MELKEKAAKADTIVCGGDITIFGDGLNTMLRKLASLKKPVILIPGNHESPDELERACQKFDTIYNVHKKTMLFNGVLFQGYGGGGFSYTYPELEALSKKFLRDKLKDTPLVFLSHAPPYKTAVDDICGEPSGSKTLRNLIQVLKPTLVVCGHIHENEILWAQQSLSIQVPTEKLSQL